MHEQLALDADQVLGALQRPNALVISAHASPEQVRALFGLSRKAFKRAVGRLLEHGSVTLNEDGFIIPRASP